MRFEFQRCRFEFEAIEPVLFPPGKCGNIVRGAFGRSFRASTCKPECVDTKSCEIPCDYRRVFEPRLDPGVGPSGLQDPPRPFVIRAWACDGRRIEPGQTFSFDLNCFDLRQPEPRFHQYAEAFARFFEDGVGPGRAKAKLRRWNCDDHVQSIDLDALTGAAVIYRLTAEFVTPTELKSEGRNVIVPEFPILFARIRDRISTLRSLYGGGPLAIDFRAMAESAAQVKIAAHNLRRNAVLRRSGRTGDQHPIGGFQGSVTYECQEGGTLNEFLPYLEAARWTGVGRQTVWGNGELRITAPVEPPVAL